MFYHINAFKQTEKKKYQLDFALEGDFDVIKNRLNEKEIITLNINQIKAEEAYKIGTIQAEILHSEDNQIHKLITSHKNIAQACLLLMFLGFNVQSITDTHNPITKEKSDQLITIVQQKIKEQKEKHQEEQGHKDKEKNKQFESEKLIKLKEIAKKTQQDINAIIKKATGVTSPNNIKHLQDIQGNLQKYARGTNANKISTTLKEAFNLMEKIELGMIDDSKHEEILLIKDSMISNVDILNEYNKRETATKIQKVGEKSTNADDKYYVFLGKLGIYIKFIRKEIAHKIGKSNYITKTTVEILNYISIIAPILYAGIILRTKSMNQNSDQQLLALSQIAIYAAIRSGRAYITKKKTMITVIGIPLVIATGYITSIIIYNTFAL